MRNNAKQNAVLSAVIYIMASAALLFASESGTLRAGSELKTMNASALRQVEIGAVPEPVTAAGEARAAGGIITAGYLDMDIGTMGKLYRGYLVLEGREIYQGGDENADLLLRLRENSFAAGGVLRTGLKKKFPFQTVCSVYLGGATGQEAVSGVFLYSRTFFSEEAAKEYQKTLSTDATVRVRFTVHYNYREISESPFRIHSIEMVSGGKAQ